MADRRIEQLTGLHAPEPIIVAEVPALDAQLWIYVDQTDVFTPTKRFSLEEWDAKTPEEHIDRVVEHIRELPVAGGAA
jgi:hypothetical protein